MRTKFRKKLDAIAIPNPNLLKEFLRHEGFTAAEEEANSLACAFTLAAAETAKLAREMENFRKKQEKNA